MRWNGSSALSTEEELKLSAILGAGAVLACMWMAKGRSALSKVEVVTENGQATNQMRVWFDGFAYPFTITVERYEEPF